MIRIGHGFDVHKFGSDSPLFLGGVEVAHHEGLIAHSDGDVVLHAVCDALLGAIAKGDIGQHFPDNNDKWKGVDSKILLTEVFKKVRKSYHIIGNLDITIIAQVPKISPHTKAMRETIARLLETDMSNVNVKATTTEKLGFIGREEGIACEAVVVLSPKF